MPRADRMKRWDYTELVKVLKFLNNNFDIWFKNHMEACAAASENTNIDRDVSSIYSKVHSLIKDMENSIEADRSPTCNILRESRKINKLVRTICIKTRERTQIEEESQERKRNHKSGGGFKVNIETNQATTAGTPTSRIDGFQMPIEIEEVKTCNERIQEIESSFQMPIEIEEVKTCNERIQEIESSFQMPIGIEEVKTLCNEKIQEIETKRKEDIEKISQIRSEMIETIMDANNKINNKYEELKQFQ